MRARRGNRRAPGEAGGVGPGACARVGGDHVARTRAEDGAFEQRVRREPVGAVHTGARHLADGVEAWQARAADQIGGDPAHEIVRGGRHGDGLSRPVPPALAHGAVDRRKAAGEERRRLLAGRAQPGRIEQHGAPALARHHVGDRAGDDVARGEFGVGVHVEHEAPPLLVAEHRPLTAYSL